MRAVVVQQPGRSRGPRRCVEVPRPDPGPGDVVVDVEAVGINPVDLGNRRRPDVGRDQPAVRRGLRARRASWPTPANRSGHSFRCRARRAAPSPSRSPSRGSTSRRGHPSSTRSWRQPFLWPGVRRSRCSSGCRWRQGRGCWSTARPAGSDTSSSRWRAGSGSMSRRVARHDDRRRLDELGVECWVDRSAADPARSAAEQLGHELDAVVDLVGGRLESSLPHVRVGGHAATIVDLSGDLELAIDRNIDLHGVLMRPGRDRLYELAAEVAAGVRPHVTETYPLRAGGRRLSPAPGRPRRRQAGGHALTRALVGSYIGRRETYAACLSPAMSTSHAPASSQAEVTGSADADERQADRARRASSRTTPRGRSRRPRRRAAPARRGTAAARGRGSLICTRRWVEGKSARRFSSAALPRKSVSHAIAKPSPTSSGQSVLSMSWP